MYGLAHPRFTPNPSPQTWAVLQTIEQPLLWCNPSVTGGDLLRVVFFAPLNGGFLHGWITGLAGMRDPLRKCFSAVKQKKVPPQGFSEDHTGPFACHLSTFD